MKILIVGTAYPYRGGMAAFNERLAYQFIQEGHEVEIYTFTLQYPSFLFPGKTQYSNGKAPKNLRAEKEKCRYCGDEILAAAYGSLPWYNSPHHKEK